MLKTSSLLILISLIALSCSHTKTSVEKAKDEDPYLWLEEIEGVRALDFVKSENAKTLAVLQKENHYNEIEAKIRKIALADDRVPWVTEMNGHLYNFWRDQKNPRGLWRRTTLSEYKKAKPNWDIVIDLDELAKKENENWVWKGFSCLPPKYNQCLIPLSRGGKDAKVVREFDIEKKKFIDDGFYLPEAKSQTNWIDQDSIFVGTDEGPGTMTTSGYPRTVKILKRHQKLSEAPMIFEVNNDDMSSYAITFFTPEKNYSFVSRSISFYETEYWYLEGDKKTLVPMPKDADFYGIYKNYLLYVLKTELITKKSTFKIGSMVALPAGKSLDELEVVFTPTDKKFLQTASITKNHILLETIDNIQGKIFDVSLQKSHKWKTVEINLGKNGVAAIHSANSESDHFLATYTDFITPTSLFYGTNTQHVEKIKTSPERFDAKNLITEQKFAKSKDGTMIPYFIIHKKDFKKDGANPTLLYGYGGFESSELPYYLNTIGKVWSEAGGVYVSANIRGGAEYGPLWHQAAVKENHQVVFDDFIAIAEDLIKEKITSPKHLAIRGGSNGGLLTGGTFVQRPDLFNAVLCEVPLLDMLRYHKLLAGASWMGEYGNPEDPKMREVISRYSPYQNVKAGVTYPEVFFLTSTKDDRVHPGHARKMVARMRQQGHPLFYFENTEGGHAGSANIEQSILWSSLEYTYLWKKLK